MLTNEKLRIAFLILFFAIYIPFFSFVIESEIEQNRILSSPCKYWKDVEFPIEVKKGNCFYFSISGESKEEFPNYFAIEKPGTILGVWFEMDNGEKIYYGENVFDR